MSSEFAAAEAIERDHQLEKLASTLRGEKVDVDIDSDVDDDVGARQLMRDPGEKSDVVEVDASVRISSKSFEPTQSYNTT